MALCLIISVLNACGLSNNQKPAPIYGKAKSSRNDRSAVTHPIGDASSSEEASWYSSEYIFGQKKESTSPQRKMSPPVLALMTEADTYSEAGNLEAAVGKIQRALRIDSRNPLLLYKLAKIRLKQSRPGQAENLAKKAAILSDNNRRLKKQSWLLISEARKQQENYHGAKEALMKANQL